MDKHQIRLAHTDSVNSVDKENFLDVELQNTSKKLHFTDIKKTIDQYEVFQDERRKCTRYRLILTINPFCTNVLFNPFTEIVNWNSEVTKSKRRYINNSVNYSGNGIDGVETPMRVQMVADTEYSVVDEDDKSSVYRNYTYYPGFDIFDNHIMRNKSFKVVNNTKNGRITGVFNTIADTVRDSGGNTRRIYTRPGGLSSKPVQIDKHLYTYDDVLSFEDSVNSNLYEENGWFGFINHSNLITEGQDKILKVLNDHKACEFIDMYPGRNLFSFSPTYNERFDRLENNWDIALTYPYENDYSSPIVQTVLYNKAVNALDVLNMYVTYGLSGEMIVVFRTYVKHNLKRGDTFSVWMTNFDGKDYVRSESFCRVKDVGNLGDGDKEYYFYTDDSELLSELECKLNPTGDPDSVVQRLISIVLNSGVGSGTYLDVNNVTTFIAIKNRYYPNTERISLMEFLEVFGSSIEPTNQARFAKLWVQEFYKIRIQKVVNGIPSKYYVRKFRKLPNFKNRKRDITEDDLASRAAFENYVDENARYTFDNERYKLGFATTAYTDDCTQITFTDTIDINHLTDNLDRPLSEIYVTIMKRNKGNKIWYESQDTDNAVWGEEVEQSHCFGKVTSGLEIGSNKTDTSEDFVNRAFYHDVKLLNNEKNSRNTYIRQSRPLEGNDANGVGMVLDDMTELYGDVVEFSPYECKEYVLSDVCYRFNTYQRENPPKGENNKYIPFIYHDIGQDDYDWTKDANTSAFEIQRVAVDTEVRNEGYYHKAHYPIQLRAFGDVQQDSHQDLTINTVTPTVNGKMYLKVKTTLRHNLNRGDKVMLFDDASDFMFWFDCAYVENRTTFLIIPSMPRISENDGRDEWEYFKELTNAKYKKGLTWLSVTEFLRTGELCLRKANERIPNYAVKAGKNTYLWRDLMDVNSLEAGDGLPEYVFTNNAFYISKPINFYLKRQDPHDTEHTYAKDNFPNDISGKLQPKSVYEYEENIVPVC